MPSLDPSASLTPYPRGWYMALASSDLPEKGVVPLKILGRDLVAFRTEDGEAHIANAHCPHFGAHLGHGGRVEDGCIRCPFHGWKFRGSDGECSLIPTGDLIPKKARLEKWPVHEIHDVIMVWFHEQGAEPDWSITEMPDYVQGGPYCEFQPYEWTIRAQIQDLSENDADVAHAPALHGFVDHPAGAEMTTDGTTCDWLLTARVHADAFGIPAFLPLVPKELSSQIRIRRQGMSLGWIHQTMALPGGLKFCSQTLAATIPISETHCKLVLRHRVAKSKIPGLTAAMLSSYAKLFNRTLEQDVVMWENKIYRMRPVASKADESVLKFRKWTRQFYPPGHYEAAMAAELERPTGAGAADVPEDAREVAE